MNAYSIRPSRRRWPRVVAVLVIAAVLFTATAAVGVHRYYQNNLGPVSSSQESVSVTIPLGSSVSEIAHILRSNNLIRSAWAFEQYIKRADARDLLKAGTYSLKPSQSVQEIVDILTEGRVAFDAVTILPEQRLDQIRAALIKKGFAEAEVDAALKSDAYAEHPALVDKPANASLEGYLYPETFHRNDGTKPQDIVRASLDEMQKRLTPELRANISKQGLTVYEGIILASIVEREVPELENRPVVAQVFLKRLREGMKLESNATDEVSELLGAQYDTYTIAGLPPEPISNVSESALRAVAEPAPTDWLFFVTGEDCVTRFGRTQAEHEANIQAHGVRKLSTRCQ